MAGVSHRRTTLPLLEKLAVRRERLPELLAALRRLGCAEAFVLSTCSRTEVYAVGVGPGVLLHALSDLSGVPTSTLDVVADVRGDEAAVTHLFRVTAGLDARILGESDVQRQVSDAGSEATKAGSMGPILTRLVSRATAVGRKVRRETALGETSRSMGIAAADAAIAAVAGRPDPSLALVGSGRMASAVAERLVRSGVDVSVFARSVQQALRLVPVRQRARSVHELPARLAGFDAVVCATSALEYVIRADDVAAAMRLRPERRLTVVDLSVPRNVENAVQDIAGVHLVDVEGLAGGDDHAVRDAAIEAEVIVADEVRAFADGQRAQQAGPMIAQMRERMVDVCTAELTRTLRGLVDPETLARAAHAVAGKVVHQPTLAARQAASQGDAQRLRDLCQLFGLEPEAGEAGAGEAGAMAEAPSLHVIHDPSRGAAARVAAHRHRPLNPEPAKPVDRNRRANRAAHVEVDQEAWRSYKHQVKGLSTMAEAVGALIEQEAARLAVADDLGAASGEESAGRRGRPGAGRRARQFAWLVVSDEAWGLLHLSAVLGGSTVARAIGELVEQAMRESEPEPAA
jgi:glutamyl-tRNA reductase